MLTLERFSIDVGDRFAHRAKAQFRAFQLLAQDGVEAVPVWSKSNREYTFIGSEPQSVFDAVLHVSFKLAAKAGARYLDLLKINEAIVAKQVTENIYERHLRPLFIG